MFLGLENHTVVLYKVDVAYRCGKGDIPDGVGFTGFKDFDAFETSLEVIKNDWFRLYSIPWSEENTAFFESALSHCFRYHIDISRMVEMTVGNNDGTEVFGVQLAFGYLNNTPRSGSINICVPSRLNQMPPEASN